MSGAWLTLSIAVLEAVGYLLYIRSSLRKDTNPNPTSWLMFAYTAMFTAIVEHDRHASDLLIIQPIAAAVFNFRIALIVFERRKKGRFWWWPEHWLDRTMFVSNAVLTVVYGMAWLLQQLQLISENERQLVALAFLIGLNGSIAVSFIPLIRNLYENPGEEYPLPWIIWIASLSLLTMLTVQNLDGKNGETMIYPLIMLVSHLIVLALSLRRNRKESADLTTTRP